MESESIIQLLVTGKPGIACYKCMLESCTLMPLRTWRLIAIRGQKWMELNCTWSSTLCHGQYGQARCLDVFPKTFSPKTEGKKELDIYGMRTRICR